MTAQFISYDFESPMADDHTISYSYQMGTSTAPPQSITPESDVLIAFTDCERIDLGSSGALLQNRANGKQLTVAPEVATALTYCNTFKTLEDHARTLVDTIPQLQGQLADVTNVLKMVTDAGLMLDAPSLCEKLNESTTVDTPLAPTRVCIITCDRAAAVERLLESMLRTGNLTGHDRLFLVDDSRNKENAAQNRELVAKFNLRSAQAMHYVGPREQQLLVGNLTTSLPQHAESIHFLLSREKWQEQKTYGLARTVTLLLSVGYRLIVLDDDTLCHTVKSPLQQEGISFGGGNGRELACFGSEQELMQNAVFGDVDPLSAHASCLGMTLRDAMTQLQLPPLEPATFAGAGAAMVNTFKGSSPVLITQCGSWGDPGTGGSNWLFHLGEDSIDRALSVSGGLASALENRHYWLGRSRPNIAKMAVMSQATGLDNSQLLPPYFPAFRSEDYLFAAMTLRLHPDSAVLDYNWSIPHLPMESRTSRGAREPIAAQAGLALCARYLADRVVFNGEVSLETRLQNLSAQILEISEQDPGQLLATFRSEMARQYAEQLQLLRQHAKDAASLESSGWEGYIQRGIEEVSSALQSPADPLAIPGADSGASQEGLVLEIQRNMGDFGKAVLAWPAIRQCAANAVEQLLEAGELNA